MGGTVGGPKGVQLAVLRESQGQEGWGAVGGFWWA